jgi:type II secretory pathway pseudopilin PulG
MHIQTTTKGMLLVELLIALAVMSVAIISAVGAFGNAQRANREVQDTALVLESISFLLADMTREAKYSADYRCSVPPCTDGTTSDVTMKRFGVNRLGKDTVTYKLVSGRVLRSITPEGGGTVSEGHMTADTVTITKFVTYVYTNPAALEPDRMRVVIEGKARDSDTPPVRVQTTITSRI